MERQNIDRSVIGVERGMQRIIALRWGISESAVSHYLNGQFSSKNKNLDMILQLREFARTGSCSKALYLVRNDRTIGDGSLVVFDNKPRRDRLNGRWFDCDERANQNDRIRCPLPEELLPFNVSPEFNDEPVKIQIRVLN